MNDKYIRVLRDGYLSMDTTQNILVIKTVSGMAMAVAAAIDALKFEEIVGCIAGDDTIMAAGRDVEETKNVMRLKSTICYRKMYLCWIFLCLEIHKENMLSCLVYT